MSISPEIKVEVFTDDEDMPPLIIFDIPPKDNGTRNALSLKSETTAASSHSSPSSTAAVKKPVAAVAMPLKKLGRLSEVRAQRNGFLGPPAPSITTSKEGAPFKEGEATLNSTKKRGWTVTNSSESGTDAPMCMPHKRGRPSKQSTLRLATAILPESRSQP